MASNTQRQQTRDNHVYPRTEPWQTHTPHSLSELRPRWRRAPARIQPGDSERPYPTGADGQQPPSNSDPGAREGVAYSSGAGRQEIGPVWREPGSAIGAEGPRSLSPARAGSWKSGRAGSGVGPEVLLSRFPQARQAVPPPRDQNSVPCQGGP